MKNLQIIPYFLVSFSLLGLSANSVQAQNLNNQQPDVFQSNEVDPLYGTSGFNPMDLIHNATFSNGRTSADFAEDTNKQLDNAANDFKQQQLQRMLELQQQPTQSSAEELTIDN